MTTPPFAATSLASLIAPGGASPAAAGGAAPADGTPRRARLAELDTHYHCSVIGTCLGTAALRKLVRRIAPAWPSTASDLEVHHEAVSQAIAGGAGARALHKALDEQHAAEIRRFAVADAPPALERLWGEALKSGAVPGAYWALMTHAAADDALRQRAFGDVHMLSHLVGAANRADIRRLVALERENAALHERNDALQQRLADAGAAHDVELVRLRAELADARGTADRLAAELQRAPTDAGTLQAALEDASDQLARQAARRELAERETLAARAALTDCEGRLARLGATHDELQAEIAALEAALARPGAVPGSGSATADAGSASCLRARLHGTRLLYVGGRPSTVAAIRALAEAAGAQWLHHDGGLEDRKGLLAAMLPRADCVVFPVDCIDHDSMQQLKRLCARHERPYRPLRTASVASFVAAMRVADDDAPLANGAALASRFCVRHG